MANLVHQRQSASLLVFNVYHFKSERSFVIVMKIFFSGIHLLMICFFRPIAFLRFVTRRPRPLLLGETMLCVLCPLSALICIMRSTHHIIGMGFVLTELLSELFYLITCFLLTIARASWDIACVHVMSQIIILG